MNELGLKWCIIQFISSIQTQLSSIERCQSFEQNQSENQKAQPKEQIVFQDSLGLYKWVTLRFILWGNSRLIWVAANRWFKGESFISCNTGQMWLIFRYFLFEKFLISLCPFVWHYSFTLLQFDSVGLFPCKIQCRISFLTNPSLWIGLSKLIQLILRNLSGLRSLVKLLKPIQTWYFELLTRYFAYFQKVFWFCNLRC